MADVITGALSHPSRMPGPAFNLPAHRCNVGSKLRDVEGSVCRMCYAFASRYRFATVKRALERRFEGIHDPEWTPAMALLLRKKRIEWFRWFDSGDIQGSNHLRNIFSVARATPKTHHWISTRELGVVRETEKLEETPDNLVVRVSATMLNGPAPNYPTTATVHDRGGAEDSKVCPARTQGNECLDCRACWDAKVKNIDYRLHP